MLFPRQRQDEVELVDQGIILSVQGSRAHVNISSLKN
jgi:hypothetical protein